MSDNTVPSLLETLGLPKTPAVRVLVVIGSLLTIIYSAYEMASRLSLFPLRVTIYVFLTVACVLMLRSKSDLLARGSLLDASERPLRTYSRFPIVTIVILIPLAVGDAFFSLLAPSAIADVGAVTHTVNRLPPQIVGVAGVDFAVFERIEQHARYMGRESCFLLTRDLAGDYADVPLGTYLSFDLRKRDHVTQLFIENIEAVVVDFTPLPPDCHGVALTSATDVENMSVVFIQVERGRGDLPWRYDARYILDSSREVKEWGRIRYTVGDGLQRRLIVKPVGKDGGAYTVRYNLVVRGDWGRPLTIPLDPQPVTYLFLPHSRRSSGGDARPLHPVQAPALTPEIPAQKPQGSQQRVHPPQRSESGSISAT